MMTKKYQKTKKTTNTCLNHSVIVIIKIHYLVADIWFNFAKNKFITLSSIYDGAFFLRKQPLTIAAKNLHHRRLAGFYMRYEGSTYKKEFSKIDFNIKNLFQLFTWATCDEEKHVRRILSFYRLSVRLSGELKSLYLLFVAHILKHATEVLTNCTGKNYKGIFFSSRVFHIFLCTTIYKPAYELRTVQLNAFLGLRVPVFDMALKLQTNSMTVYR